MLQQDKETPMNITLRRRTASVLLTAAGLLAGSAAWSQAARPAGCDPRQDPAACAREAGAARQEAARGGLTQPGATAGQNATARCQALPADDRADCEARVSGDGDGATTRSGSVMGGGVVKETVTPVPVAPSR
jgi:hypothetical protein